MPLETLPSEVSKGLYIVEYLVCRHVGCVSNIQTTLMLLLQQVADVWLGTDESVVVSFGGIFAPRLGAVND